MKSIAQNKRYLQHEVTTKLYAVRLYRQVGDVQFVCRRYHISKASLMRWNKQYDGTRESLEPKSHRPKTPHPKRMLRFTDKSIEEIGLECGIGELNYFSRVFKKLEGISPSEFRRLW